MTQTNFQVKVPGEGPKDCKIAFVGEAPEQHGARERRPFVEYASAGIAFNQMLQVARIYRPECYVTNVFKQRAPGDNTKIWLDYGRKNVKESEYYRQCLDYLKEELSETTANVIVAVGADALWALCNLKAITNRRGSIFESTLLPGRKVISMLHPASTLLNRKPKMFHLCVFDLQRIREESEFPEIKLPQRNLIIDPSFEEVIAYLNSIIRHEKEIAFDYETIGDDITHVSFSTNGKEAICIHFYEKGKNIYPIKLELEIWHKIARILENPNIQKIGHNLSFDNTMSFEKYGICVRSNQTHFDTMIAQVFINPDLDKNLGITMSLYTKEPYYKDDIKRWKGIVGGEELFKRYSARDSAVCIDIKKGAEKDLEILDNTLNCEMQTKLIDPLVYMSQRGIRIDEEGISQESENAKKKIEELSDELNKLVGYEINPNSNPQLKQLFYEEMKIHPYKKRVGNKYIVTLDKFALGRIAKGTATRPPCREAKLVQNIRFYTKRKGTYYDVKLKDGRLHSAFNPVGTKQHRLSSSRDILDRGTNLENQPAEMKRILLADEDYVCYEMDLRNADSRVTAYIAPEPKMIDAFENNIDIYCRTVGMLRNKDENDVSREKGTCFICPDPENCGHNERYGGKKTVLGYNYGWGYKDFAMKNDILEKTAKELRIKYLEGYRGIPDMWRWIEYNIKEYGLLRNCFNGAYRFLLNPDPRTHFKTFLQGYSYIPQSTVADKINWHGVLHVWENLEFVELLNQVHDSIWFQIPLSQSWKYHAQSLLSIKNCLEQSLEWKGVSFIIPVECKMGLNFGDMKEIELNQESVSIELKLRETYESLGIDRTDSVKSIQHTKLQ